MGQDVSSKLVRYIHYCSTGTFNPQMEDDDDDDEYHHVSSDPRLSLTSTTIPASPSSPTGEAKPATGSEKSKDAVSASHIDVANETEEDSAAAPAPALNHSLNDDHRAIVST